MNDGIRLRCAADIAAIEARGLDWFLPHPTPYAILQASAARHPDAVAIRYLHRVDDPASDSLITYADLLGRVRQAANLFRRCGVGPTDAVAILMPHTPEAQIALWAAEIAGRACPLNPMLNAEHLGTLLKAAGVKLAVALGVNGDLDIWRNVLPALRQAGVTIVFESGSDAASPGSDGVFEQLMGAEDADALDFEPETDADAVAAYFHTGGTTGAPKLALHTRRNQAFVGRGAAMMYDLGPDDIVVNGFPLFHVAGSFVYGLSVLSAGGTILIPTRLGMRTRAFIASIWRQVEFYRITCLGAVPTVMSALLGVPVDADISSLRVILTGGSPLPTELAGAFERTIGTPVRNILGMTECAGIVTVEPFHGPRTAASTGLRLPFTQVCAFRSDAAGVDLASPCMPGETGVIALRGSNVGPGYSEAARNAGTFEASGWLISGDLGHVDAEERVYVTGRAKDVIIRGAHNIDPSIIEAALLQHPDVAIAAAVGQPDAYAGELPVAFVTLNDGASIGGEALRDFITPLVAEPAALPKTITVLAELPLTPVGKIYKPALRAIAAKRAFEEALLRAGLPVTAFILTASETSIGIRLADPIHDEAARRALLGMPIRYEISNGFISA